MERNRFKMFLQLIVLIGITSQATSSLVHLDPVELILKPGPSSETLQNVICAVNVLSISNQKSPNGNSFTLSALNPLLCTHLMLVNGAAISKNSSLAVTITDPVWEEIKSLKSINPSLRVILTIGGWDAGTKGFQEVGRDEKKMTIFLDSVFNQLRFTSVDIDSVAILWMWPGISYRGGDDKDQTDLSLIVYKLYNKLQVLPKKPSVGLVLPGHLIGPNYRGFDLKKLSPIISTFYILAQDFAGNWAGVSETAHPAPLYGKKSSINTTITELLKVLPAKKLILGLPFFGRSFLLKNPHTDGLSQAHDGIFKSDFDNDRISIKYQEICHLVKEKGFKVFYDNESIGQFGINDKKWVGFDGVESLREKVSYVEKHGLGGVMPWTIDYDDYNGKWCGGQKWALLGGFLPTSNEVGNSNSSTGSDVDSLKPRDGDGDSHGHHVDTNNAGHQVVNTNSGDGLLSMKKLVVFCGFLVHVVLRN